MSFDVVWCTVLFIVLLGVSLYTLHEVRRVTMRTKRIARMLRTIEPPRPLILAAHHGAFSLSTEIQKVVVALAVWFVPLLLFGTWYVFMGVSPEWEAPKWFEKFIEHNLAIQITGIELLLLIAAMLIFVFCGAENLAIVFQDEIGTVCYHTTTFFLSMCGFVAIVRRRFDAEIVYQAISMVLGILLSVGLMYLLSEARSARKRNHHKNGQR